MTTETTMTPERVNEAQSGAAVHSSVLLGELEFHNADCMAVMSKHADKYFDLAICDPPYGIFGGKSCNMDWNKECDGSRTSKYGKKPKQWDVAPPAEYFDELRRVSKNQIIWGANYFGYPFHNFAVWRKLTISENFSMSMAEIASVSCSGNGKVFEYMPQDVQRFHPTQKPVALYSWLLEHHAKDGDRILDTHMGSGSLAVACYNRHLPFVGCEIDPEYYEATIKRIKRETSQTRLFS